MWDCQIVWVIGISNERESRLFQFVDDFLWFKLSDYFKFVLNFSLLFSSQLSVKLSDTINSQKQQSHP